jgi:NADH-quinone oxidoreductase subunit J
MVGLIFSSFCLSLIINSLCLFIVSNPVHSVLFMIFGFCNGSVLLFFLGVEFLSLIFVIIYVGAIAILFLFVIMMLDIKHNKMLVNSNDYYLFFFIYFYLFSFILIFLKINFFFNEEIFFFLYDSNNEIKNIGQSIYNFYNLNFLIAGLILLISIVGPISLTLNFNPERASEILYKQLSRSVEQLVFYKNHKNFYLKKKF